MPAIRDLDPINYLPVDCPALRAVGWLGRDTDYPRGSVSNEFLEKLKQLCLDPWQPVASGGAHACDLCQFDGPAFSNNLFVPHEGMILVAPVGIVHYIAAHWYLPPESFIQGVLASPPMRSIEYLKALLVNGGRSLIQPAGI